MASGIAIEHQVKFCRLACPWDPPPPMAGSRYCSSPTSRHVLNLVSKHCGKMSYKNSNLEASSMPRETQASGQENGGVFFEGK